MSHYPFAEHAHHTLGISFVTEGGRKACYFARSKPDPTQPFPARPKELEKSTDSPFTVEFQVLDNQQGLLAVEVNAWSAKPYRAPAGFLLGNATPFSGNGDEAPYTIVAARDPMKVDRSMTFTYHPHGRGEDKDRPYVSWTDELGGGGEYVFTLESPGAVIALRLGEGVKGVLRLGKTSPWGPKTIIWPEP